MICAAEGCNAVLQEPLGHIRCRSHAPCSISYFVPATKKGPSKILSVWHPEACAPCYEAWVTWGDVLKVSACILYHVPIAGWRAPHPPPSLFILHKYFIFQLPTTFSITGRRVLNPPPFFYDLEWRSLPPSFFYNYAYCRAAGPPPAAPIITYILLFSYIYCWFILLVQPISKHL